METTETVAKPELKTKEAIAIDLDFEEDGIIIGDTWLDVES